MGLHGDSKTKLLHQIPAIKCEEFAPYFNGKCEDEFLVKIGDYSGGSMGWHLRHNLYGLFELDGGRRWIVPLRTFYKKNSKTAKVD